MRNRNPGTRLGRPPTLKMPTLDKLPSGERQGLGPTSVYDSAVPGKAYRQGAQRMPQHHDDPAFNRGGPIKRR